MAAHTGLPLASTLPVVQALRAAVTEHADRNAEVGWDDRAGLSRTDIERIVTDTAALVDRASLTAAVASGSCEPVDFDTPSADPEFYSGTGTQPGHIAAGLVAPRPAVTNEVLAGLGSGRAVLIVGPSGIGKSAVLWMAAYVARHVVWCRVHRLGADDVEPLIRLATANGAGRHGPVGFIIDGVGTGSLAAWDELQQRAARGARRASTRGWRTSNKKPVANQRSIELVRAALRGLDVEWLHVRGHADTFKTRWLTSSPMLRQPYSRSAPRWLQETYNAFAYGRSGPSRRRVL